MLDNALRVRSTPTPPPAPTAPVACPQASWVGVHSARANAMVRALLERRLLAGLPPYGRVQAEVKFGEGGKSRVDFLLHPPDADGSSGAAGSSAAAEADGSAGAAPKRRRTSKAAAAAAGRASTGTHAAAAADAGAAAGGAGSRASGRRHLPGGQERDAGGGPA